MRKLLLIFFVCAIFAQVEGQAIIRANPNHRAVVSAGSDDPYDAVYAAMTVPPTGDTVTWQNDMVYSLDSASLWDRMDVLYIFANRNVQAAYLNWKDPTGDDNVSDGNSTAFTKYQGFIGDGSSDNMTTNFNPASEGVNYAQNSAAYGLYTRTNTDDQAHIFACNDGTTYVWLRPSSSDTYSARINCGNVGMSGTSETHQGFYILTRTAADACTVYRNKALIETETDVSNGEPNSNVILLKNVDDSAYSVNEISIFFIMDGVSTNDRDALYDIFQRYMTRIGKQI